MIKTQLLGTIGLISCKVQDSSDFNSYLGFVKKI